MTPPRLAAALFVLAALWLAMLLLGRALTSWPRHPAVIALVCVAATGVLGFGLADQQLNGSNPRVYDFKTAVNDIESRARPGDLMALWTNDRWVSTLHRVVNSDGNSARRQSFAFFHQPNWDAMVSPLPVRGAVDRGFQRLARLAVRKANVRGRATHVEPENPLVAR